MKDNRSAIYQSQLKEIDKIKGNIDPKSIEIKLADLSKQYRITFKVNKNGKMIVDTSKAAMGKAGRNDIKEVIKDIGEWDDFTPSGLDALKRRVDDFYSDSSQARGFVTAIKNTIKDTIVKNVPEYAEMTKGYAGKILKVNLTNKEISILDTENYEEFGGGVGIGAAIFWDLAVVPGDWDLPT